MAAARAPSDSAQAAEAVGTDAPDRAGDVTIYEVTLCVYWTGQQPLTPACVPSCIRTDARRPADSPDPLRPTRIDGA